MIHLANYKKNSLCSRLTRTKTFNSTEETDMNRILGPFSLLILSISDNLGAGVITVLGIAITKCGPSAILAIIIAGVSCYATALSYCEFSKKSRMSGSSYCYAYQSLGELIGYIIGCSIIYSLILGSAAIARSWSEYFEGYIGSFGVKLPSFLLDNDVNSVFSFNGVAALIVAIVVLISFKGMQDSTLFNNIILVINVAALFGGIVFGLIYFKIENIKGMFNISLQNFTETIQLCFFVFLGYDNATCFTEESKDPKKDIPLAIKLGLFLSISLNSLLAFALLGMAGPNNINTSDAFLMAFDATGHKTLGYIITIGPLMGLLSALICGINGVSKILYYMADDGLLHNGFKRLDGPQKVSLNSLLFSGIVVLVFGSFFSLEELEETVCLACLVEYTSVNMGFLVTKYQNSPRSSFIKILLGVFCAVCYFVGLSIYYRMSFIVTLTALGILLVIVILMCIQKQEPSEKLYWVPIVPMLGAIMNIGFAGILGMTPAMLIFGVYIAIALIYYAAYSLNHSKLAREPLMNDY